MARWRDAGDRRARSTPSRDGIKIVDWEYDWNEHHEDLQLPFPGTDLGGSAFAKYTGFNDQHGTAVMGILGAIDNDYGVTGGVPDAQLYGLSPTRASGAYAPGPSLAYLAALQDEDGEPFLKPGDAVLLEAALKLIEVDPPQTEAELTSTDVTGPGWHVKRSWS